MMYMCVCECVLCINYTILVVFTYITAFSVKKAIVHKNCDNFESRKSHFSYLQGLFILL